MNINKPACLNLLYRQLFPSYRPFWHTFTEWPQWSWTLHGQRYPLCVTIVPNVSLFSVRQAVLTKLQAIWDKCTEWPQNYIEHNAIYVLLMSLSPQFHPIFPYKPRFLRYKVSDNWKCTKWPQNVLGYLNNQNCPIYIKYVPLRSKCFVRITLRPTVLKIQGCWKSEIHRMTLIGLILNPDLKHLTVKIPCIYMC